MTHWTPTVRLEHVPPPGSASHVDPPVKRLATGCPRPIQNPSGYQSCCRQSTPCLSTDHTYRIREPEDNVATTPHLATSLAAPHDSGPSQLSECAKDQSIPEFLGAKPWLADCLAAPIPLAPHLRPNSGVSYSLRHPNSAPIPTAPISSSSRSVPPSTSSQIPGSVARSPLTLIAGSVTLSPTTLIARSVSPSPMPALAAFDATSPAPRVAEPSPPSPVKALAWSIALSPVTPITRSVLTCTVPPVAGSGPQSPAKLIAGSVATSRATPIASVSDRPCLLRSPPRNDCWVWWALCRDNDCLVCWSIPRNLYGQVCGAGSHDSVCCIGSLRPTTHVVAPPATTLFQVAAGVPALPLDAATDTVSLPQTTSSHAFPPKHHPANFSGFLTCD
ncbi:hypothetical protein HOY80DRAFT_1102782 [Tuber brumale]|nr:hypothetical protein HOY80DRAFT_1102782 [Tuber brumale]